MKKSLKVYLGDFLFTIVYGCYWQKYLFEFNNSCPQINGEIVMNIVFRLITWVLALPQRRKIKDSLESLLKETWPKYAHMEDEHERAKCVLESFALGSYGEVYKKCPREHLDFFEQERSRMINKIANIVFNETWK